VQLSSEEWQALALTPPRTEDDLWNWCRLFAGVEVPREPCPCHGSSPFDAFCAAYFAKDDVVIWKASRGFGGKSMMLGLLAWVESITLAASTTILGGSGEQSERVHAYLAGTHPNARNRFWESPYAPRYILSSDPSRRRVRLRNGAEVVALAASQRSVRGPHPQRLRLDEIDEMPRDVFDAAMGQAMSHHGVRAQTVWSSTHHNPDGTMTYALERAAESGFPVFEWCYRATAEPHGWLTAGEVERKQRTVPAVMWRHEYELQEPSPENRAIDATAIAETFDPALGKWEGLPGEPCVVEKAMSNRLYYHGTDWARDQDWTVIHSMAEIGDGPDRLVRWIRDGRKPWPMMIAEHNRTVTRYGGRSSHDATGVGEVCDDYLQVESEGFDFRRRKDRTEMLSTYIAALENGVFVYPDIRWMRNEHKFAAYDDIYGSGHLPDSISAAALAYRAKRIGLTAEDYYEDVVEGFYY
jgi:hypothetical protein